MGALFFNLGKYLSIVDSSDDAPVGELRSCFNDVLAKMPLDVETHHKIDAQYGISKDRQGTFANVMEIQNMDKINPFYSWRSYGGRAIELQSFAKCIVCLCASSSGCERNWSAFEFNHTEKRNRLEHLILNDNVFVSYNWKNMDMVSKEA